jgi:hypothetical protein
MLSEAYLRGFMNRLGDKMAAASDAYIDYAAKYSHNLVFPEASLTCAHLHISVTTIWWLHPTTKVRKNLRTATPWISCRGPDFHFAIRNSCSTAPSSPTICITVGSLVCHSRRWVALINSVVVTQTAEKPTVKPTIKPKASGDKPDNVLPAYCNPPNPCPIGYTGESTVPRSAGDRN